MSNKRPKEKAGLSERLKMLRKKWIFKISSIILIAIFIAIIIIGIIRENHPGVAPTNSQLSMAKELVQTSLKSVGDDIANYTFVYSKKLRGGGLESKSKSLLRICLYRNSSMHMYWIDVIAQKIVMHSEITDYIKLDERYSQFYRAPVEC